MYRKENNTICGVLNDFDLALFTDDDKDGPTSRQRTGTEPFMAIDLLEDPSSPPQHLYRHDLESLFYVMVFITTRYDKGKEIKRDALEEWLVQLGTAQAGVKRGFLLEPPPSSTDSYKAIEPLVSGLHTLFARGYWEQKEHRERQKYKRSGMVEEYKNMMKLSSLDDNYDEETLGGIVTFDTFNELLQMALEEV